jgi:hypothetical protein
MHSAVVTCHVVRPLDDSVWDAFARLQRRRPGGFAISALLRPPDRPAGEDVTAWADRARVAAALAPLGHHTHFGGPDQARPTVSPDAAASRVEEEIRLFRAVGLRPRFFCGGGWYMREEVAEVLARHGYVDCTALAFRPNYFAPGERLLHANAPVRLRLSGGAGLLELPTTHSLRALGRDVLRPSGLGTTLVHAYFHDTDLLTPRRRLALLGSLRLLGQRRHPVDLDTAAEQADSGSPDMPFPDDLDRS